MAFQNRLTTQIELVESDPYMNYFPIEPHNANQPIHVPVESNSTYEWNQPYGESSYGVQPESVDRQYLDLDNNMPKRRAQKAPRIASLNPIIIPAKKEIVPPQPFLNPFTIKPINANQVIPVPVESNSTVESGQPANESTVSTDKAPRKKNQRKIYSSEKLPCIGCDRRRILAPLFDASIEATDQDAIEIVNYIRANNKRGKSKLKFPSMKRMPHVNNIEELGPRREFEVCREECLYQAQKYINLRQTGKIFCGAWLLPQPPSEKPDLSFFRHGIACINECIFECHRFSQAKPTYKASNKRKLDEISKAHRHLLLMHFKFYIDGANARMCSTHLKTANWWPLVKQIDRKLPPHRRVQVMELMYQYYNEQFFVTKANGKKVKDAKQLAEKKRQEQIINNVPLQFNLPDF